MSFEQNHWNSRRSIQLVDTSLLVQWHSKPCTVMSHPRGKQIHLQAHGISTISCFESIEMSDWSIENCLKKNKRKIKIWLCFFGINFTEIHRDESLNNHFHNLLVRLTFPYVQQYRLVCRCYSHRAFARNRWHFDWLIWVRI